MTFSSDEQTIVDMLSYRRLGRSQTELEFIDRFIMPLKPDVDPFGNLWVEVGVSPILWSSHTDTVHHYGGQQGVHIDKDGFARLNKPKAGTCLGADCGSGVWLMTEMIKANVPGTYIFHRDEETGGKGSSYIARNHKDQLEHKRFAIAFDRKGYKSIITHQAYDRCCSEAFSDSFNDILGGNFVSDDTGTFTDTANYTDLIGECTNLSVGYFDQHGPRETQHVPFLIALRDRLVSSDFSTLVQKREPGEIDLESKFYNFNDYWKNFEPQPRSPALPMTLLRYIKTNPDIVADYMEACGVDLTDLQAYEEQLWK